MENRDETKTSIFAFYDSIEDDIIKDDQMEDAVEWLDSFRLYVFNTIKDTIVNLYILLIDYIYFDNQNMLMGYKIKELARTVEGERIDGTQPYTELSERYKDFLTTALSELDMKYLDQDNKTSYNIEEILSNPELSLDNISDYGSLMDLLRKYSKEEKYIW